ncbi:DUF3558 family protein [Lentzea aerocolonigenes]|uniref:DUF3558 family protein n=1 Tax=Lentzea aerocolonigenes TaxID=68170 RepID=UPI0018C895DD|nr:DUF3558 family protein [Lentzea aerocolonigenes]
MLVAAAGCGGTTSQAGLAQTTTTTTSTRSAGTSSAGPSGTLDADRPCELVTASELTSIGINGTPKEERTGSTQECVFDRSNGIEGVRGFGIRTALGLKDFRVASGEEVADIIVGGRKAKQLKATGGTCLIGVDISESSRLDVTARSGEKDMCPQALELAQLVAKNLP